MSTAPWQADTPALLAAGPLTHVCAATVVAADGDRLEMPVVDGTLTFDESRAPRVDASVTTHLLPDLEFNAKVEPRAITRVLLDVGYLRPDGITDSHPIANLGLRGKRRARPADELVLAGMSDEALLLDTAPGGLDVDTGSTVAAIQHVIHLVLPAATISVDVSTPGPAVFFEEPDVDKWTAVADFADRITAVVYDNGLRVWQVTDRPNTLTAPVLTLRDGAAGTLVEVAEDTDRDIGWYNRVRLVYRWRDATDIDRVIYGAADATGPYAPVAGNAKTLKIQRDTPTTDTAADAAAQTLVKRVVTRGVSYQVTAPSCYWLRPGMTVAVAEADRTEARQLVVSVSFNLRTGLMSITTRQPD